MSQHDFTSEILLPIDARNSFFARDFWEIIQSDYSDLMPGRYGTSEPLQNVFSGESINELISDEWLRAFLFIWRSISGKHNGTWTMTNGYRHSSCFLWGKATVYSTDKVKQIYRRLAETYPVNLAFIHRLSQDEFNETKNWHRQMYSPLSAGFNRPDLRERLPNLGWGTYLGRPYVELIGINRLLDSPAVHVEQWGEGVYIEITESLDDVVSNYRKFDDNREFMKRYIGINLFFDPTGSVREYLAPNFEFPSK